jgi:NAD(P)-dependent dehydrogenase (short-subunit alcohol dehydrogenase family)
MSTDAGGGTSRSILITGCSSPRGIGFATARALAAAGHRVVATVRDHSNEARLLDGTENLSVISLDVLNANSVRAAVATVHDRHGRIDTLINNAGYGLIGGIEQATAEQARAEFETNYFGTIDLVRAVLPLMRAQGSGHILAVSTVFSATLCPPALGHYIGSKAALETALQALAVEAAPFGVRVTIVQPGPVNTELSRDWARPADDPRPDLIDTLYDWIGACPELVLEDPADVAQAIVRIVEDTDPPLAAQTCAEGTAWVATALRDPSRRSEQRLVPQADA